MSIPSIEMIRTFESLDELKAFLCALPETNIRADLLSGFDALIEYVDANEWAAIVRTCEALAIVGWGDRERVDAIAHYNGDCWDTKLVTDKNECRFRFGRWLKRKAGWVLRNPEYHASPDFPEKQSVDWHHFAKSEFPIVNSDKLPTQRNCMKQMPVTMGQIGGTNPTSNAVARLKQELTLHLRNTMTPSAYGDTLDRFFLTFHCPAVSQTFERYLKIGAYNSKQRAFYCDLYFDESFGTMSPREQRDYIGDNLLVAIDAIDAKFKKRKIEYDIIAFRRDAIIAIERWHKEGGS